MRLILSGSANGDALALADDVVRQRVVDGKHGSQKVPARGSFDGRWRLPR